MNNEENGLLKKLKSGCIIEKWILFIPIVFLVLSTILYFLSFSDSLLKNCFQIFEQLLKTKIFSETRVSSLINISVVLIGFYITIMSIFGSNFSTAIVDISEKGLGGKFIAYTKGSLISAFIYFIVTIFFDIFKLKFFIFIYSAIFLWVITNMIRITYITIKLYGYNINNANEEIKKQNNVNQQMITLLQEIKDLHNRKDDQYYQNLKKTVQKQKENAKIIPYDEDI